MLSDIEEPVEDIVVIFGGECDFVGAVEDGCGFFIDGGGDKEGGVCGLETGSVAAVDEAGLSRAGDPVAWWAVFEVVGWLAGEG